MKAAGIFIVLLFFTFISLAEDDSTSGAWNIQARGDFGFIIAHKQELIPIQQAHVKGLEVSIARHTSGKSDWESSFGYPDYGLTLAAFDLGSPDRLGKGFALYPYIDFPLRPGMINKLYFRYGVGVGYVEKIFDPDHNVKNAAISSHVNAVIHIDLHYSRRISERGFIGVGAGITHFSNGSFSIPNLGINIATANIDYRHSFGKKEALARRPKKEIARESQIHVYAGGFPKKIYPPKGSFYFAGTLSGMYFKPVNTKSAWGIGVDASVDRSLAKKIERFEERKTSAKDSFRSGIFGAWHVSINRLGIMFNLGYYLYTPWKGDGNIYHRICSRYYFRNTFIGLNLKTHYARADYVELGFGYRFIKNRQQ